jgi:hypothetical protein
LIKKYPTEISLSRVVFRLHDNFIIIVSPAILLLLNLWLFI